MDELIKIKSENKEFSSVKEAVCELAFCRYPVTVIKGGEEKTFIRFDDAKAFVEKTY